MKCFCVIAKQDYDDHNGNINLEGTYITSVIKNDFEEVKPVDFDKDTPPLNLVDWNYRITK